MVVKHLKEFPWERKLWPGSGVTTSGWRARWEWLQADTKTTTLTVSTARGGSWWPLCALRDTGGCSRYSKTNSQGKSSIRWNSITCRIPFRLDTPSVSVSRWDANLLWLLPTQNIRLTLWGARLGRSHGEDAQLIALYLGRWLLMGQEPRQKLLRAGPWLPNWQLGDTSDVSVFSERGVWKFWEKEHGTVPQTQGQCYLCPICFPDQDLEEKRT